MAKGPAADGLILKVEPSRLLPELVGARGVVATEEGQQRVLVDRMRLIARPDGSLLRAAELLPGGNVASIALPSRLGGGYLFYANPGNGTHVWRASSWLDKLRPLARLDEPVGEIVPGFDRLYVRYGMSNRVLAIHPDTGKRLPLGPLPAAGTYGMLAFADGWRAVVDTDLRGPLATFDAGVTWRPMGVTEKPQGVGIFDGDPGVIVSGGARWLIDARGVVTRHTEPRARSSAPDEIEPLQRRPSPLGRRPLRAAIEDGWPDTRESAVVARGGALARVSLRDGSVLAMAEEAYPEARANCHAVRLGAGVGFVCGERDAATVVYQYAPPLAMRPVMRFDKPRFVASSGNGALVIRGRCGGDEASAVEADARWYCVRSPAGATREIRVKGFDLGVERIVGLADGRVAVLVPPRGGSPGDLSVVGLDGRATKVELKLLAEPLDAARQLKRGLWLDGFEERAPGVLGGWVEAGGPVVGVEIALDGAVKAGEVQADAAGAVFGGRFAVLLFEGERAMETSDGGMTWSSFDLPNREEEARAVPSRAAGPVGAALPGWMRVGWGDPATPDDMRPAEPPRAPDWVPRVSPTITLTCDVTSVATPPLPDKPRPAPPPPRPRARFRGGPVARTQETATAWRPFRNTPPPALGAEDYGIDAYASDGPLLHAYVWGKKGASFARTGRWLLRFDDRFDPAGGLRGGALTASPWADEAAALEAFTGGSYGSVHWSGILDPGGHAMLATACRGTSSCALYAVGDGQPMLPIRDASGKGGAFTRPYAHGAVRVGDTWFFLVQSGSNDVVTLWRVDLGAARPIASYFRPTQRATFEAPRLVRRALGGGVGVLVLGQPEPGAHSATWYLLPVDAETGALGEAVPLLRRDLGGAPLTRCAPEQDGWTFDLTLDATMIVEPDNARASIEAVELRVRADPGRACVEAMAGRSGSFYAIEPKGAAAHGPAKALTAPPGRKASGDLSTALPMAVTERGYGRRWGLACWMKPHARTMGAPPPSPRRE